MATVAAALSGSSGPVADALTVTAELLRRSTVQVRANRAGGGSGVIWAPDGLIVTNAHVARGPRAEVELADGEIFEAEVTARDRDRDLAALRIEARELPAARVGDSDALRVGQLVAAVGNPLGLTGALTLGIVHAIAPAEGSSRQSWVQADVHLAPGNSGGPLADVTGRVVGVNSMVAGGLGLAVPSNAVQRFLGTGGLRPRLGLTLQPVTVRATGSGPTGGMLVLEVVPGGAAEKAGLLVGDILTAATGTAPDGPAGVLAAFDSAVPGGLLQLDVLRGGLPHTVVVHLPPTATRATEEAA